MERGWGDGVGIQMDGAGKIDVMRLKIKGSGGRGWMCRVGR
ncbi:hypothetical protein [Bartonella bovis]|nr:hypothetical protein [Bartonella bovis]